MRQLTQKTTMTASNFTEKTSLSLGSRISAGERVLLRIPQSVEVKGPYDVSVPPDSSIADSTLPLTSKQDSRQHTCFISNVSMSTDRSFMIIEAYPTYSFNNNAVEAYRQMSPAKQSMLIPLPSLSLRHPTPALFGPPLDFGGWSDQRDSFISVVSKKFIYPRHRKFKKTTSGVTISENQIKQIINYLHALEAQPESNGQNGGLEGGGMGDKGLGGAGGSTNILGPADGFLECADMDDESGDFGNDEPTLLDDLLLLAETHDMWKEDLNRYLEDQQRAQKSLQVERLARIPNWLSGTEEIVT